MQQLNALFIVDAKGQVINSSREHPVEPLSVADRLYFKNLAEGRVQGLVIDRPVISRVTKQWTLNLARRLNGPDGSLRGVVVAAVNIQHFEQLYSFMKMEYVRPIALYMENGTLIASLPHRENVIGDVAHELATERLPAPGDEIRIINHASGDGGQQVFAVGHMKRYPLLVSVTSDEVQTLASWRESAFPIAGGALVVCIFLALASSLLVREVKREEALSKSLDDADTRYHQTIDSLLDAIVAVDEEQNILLFNPAAESMFGYVAGEVIGKHLSMLMPGRAHAAHSQHVAGFQRAQTGSRNMGANLDVHGLRADGSEFPIESSISRTLIDGKSQLTAVLRDVTERRRAEAALNEMNRQLRELYASLQGVREQERSRIARELHDELGQQLTGLKLDLSWLSRRLKDGREAPFDKVDDMRESLDASIASVRRISTELRPLILDDLGFGEAVIWQADELSRRSGLKIKLDLPAAGLITEDELATALFRIVQESLTNVVRHAQATQATVSLTATNEALTLCISDNGTGIGEGMRKGGIGVVSMRERAMACGADFSITSSPGAGTKITVRLALPPTNPTESQP
jgi:PAS domain S-box-containing protein